MSTLQGHQGNTHSPLKARKLLPRAGEGGGSGWGMAASPWPSALLPEFLTSDEK